MLLIKNICNFFIVFLLTINQIGIINNMHFCSGKLFSVSFFNQSKNCGMHESNSVKDYDSLTFIPEKCCQDTQLHFSTKEFKKELTLDLKFKIKPTNKAVYDNLIIYNLASKEFSSDLHPPPLINKKLFLINSQLLVYG